MDTDGSCFRLVCGIRHVVTYHEGFVGGEGLEEVVFLLHVFCGCTKPCFIALLTVDPDVSEDLSLDSVGERVEHAAFSGARRPHDEEDLAGAHEARHVVKDLLGALGRAAQEGVERGARGYLEADALPGESAAAVVVAARRRCQWQGDVRDVVRGLHGVLSVGRGLL
jgi:hypothetical protein